MFVLRSSDSDGASRGKDCPILYRYHTEGWCNEVLTRTVVKCAGTIGPSLSMIKESHNQTLIETVVEVAENLH